MYAAVVLVETSSVKNNSPYTSLKKLRWVGKKIERNRQRERKRGVARKSESREKERRSNGICRSKYTTHCTISLLLENVYRERKHYDDKTWFVWILEKSI